MIGNKNSRISYQLRDIYTPYAGAAGMLQNINGKCKRGKIEIISFVVMFRS